MVAVDRPILVLHVGAMKTGTTFIQDVLNTNREVFAAAGWVVPRQNLTVRAVREVLGGDGREPTVTGPQWTKLVAEARTKPATIVSMEFLSFATPDRAKAIVDSLAGFDVRVVVTARSAVNALPSQWQSLVRNQGRLSWAEFTDGLTGGRGANARRAKHGFKRTQNIARVLDVWADAVGPANLTVVTYPIDGVGLWDRFVQAVDPQWSQLTLAEVPRANPTLGLESCDALRRVNRAGLRKTTPGAYRQLMRYTSRTYLVPLRHDEAKAVVDQQTAKFAAKVNKQTSKAIASLGVKVVGDVARDLSHAVPDGVPVSAPVPDETLVARALAGIAQGVRDLAEREGVRLAALPTSYAVPVRDDEIDQLKDACEQVMEALQK